MATPPLFVEKETSRLHAIVRRHAFGTLVVPTRDGAAEIAHVPFMLDTTRGPHGELRCHVSRASSLLAAVTAGNRVVAIFAGPHGYVSPRWYETPTRQVPTWNYAVVHAHGHATPITDVSELRALVQDLSAEYESESENPWDPSWLDPAFFDHMIHGIIGLHIAIERLDGRFKLSQNRSPADAARVAQAFRDRATPDDLEMAALMSERATRGPSGETP